MSVQKETHNPYNKVVVLFLTVLPSLGCQSPSNMPLRAEKAVESSDGTETMTLRHDFGILEPGQVVVHRFAVSNPTRHAWKFARFHSNCTCTVTRALSPEIAPGTATEVEVEFKANKVNGKHYKEAFAELSGVSAPLLRFAVLAEVRDSITLVPDTIAFRAIEGGRSETQPVTIYSFLGVDVESVHVRAKDRWLKTRLIAINTVPGESGSPGVARQSWRALITADPSELEAGNYTADVVFDFKASEPRTRTVRVSAAISPRVIAVPSQLFFGRIVPCHGGVKRIVKLKCADRDLSAFAGGIRIRHDLGEQFKVDCIHEEWGWSLTGTLEPKNGARTINGTIRVNFNDARIKTVTIPVVAMVADP